MKIDQNPSHLTPRELLRHHVTGAIERGEADAIIEQPSLPGAEAMRDLEHATPEFDLPFALTPPPAAKDDGAQSGFVFVRDDGIYVDTGTGYRRISGAYELDDGEDR